MPIDAAAGPSAAARRIADRRILRLAFGTSLCLFISQAFGTGLSFIAPILTLVVLCTPLPAFPLKSVIAMALALLLPIYLGSAVLLPFFQHLHVVGILLVTLALFHSFYFVTRGGSPLLGTFVTIGVTLNVTIGSVNIDLLVVLVQGLTTAAILGLGCVWIAHALMPDPPPAAGAQKPPPAAPKEPLQGSRRRAMRASLVVLPIAVLFLFSSASASYTPAMIKIATMGQQARAADSRSLGIALVQSTFWGGVAAIIAWQLLTIWPSLILYTLLVAIAALRFGRRIFLGAGLHPQASMWSYAFTTMMILLAPAVLDGPAGTPPGPQFWSRLILLAIASLYGCLAMIVFDAFLPGRRDSGADSRAGKPEVPISDAF